MCAYVLPCQRVFRAYVLMCQHFLRAYMLTWQLALRAYVLTRQRPLRALRAYVPTCSRAVTTNNKNNFSTIRFPYIFVIALCLVLWLLLWNMHCSYQAEAFNGCYDKLCAIKWFDFCFSTSLRVIFNLLIKGKRWIIMCRRKWIYKELFKHLAIAPYCLTRLLNQ